MEGRTKSARGSAEPRECRQEERKICLHVFYYGRVLCGTEVVSCSVLREMILKALKVLSHRALETEMTKLRRKEQRKVAESARRKCGAGEKTSGG